MSQIVDFGFYRHHKGGKYILLGVANDSTNARSGNKVCIYLSTEVNQGLYVRDLTEWNEEVEWPDGIRRPRFIPFKEEQ